MRIISEQHERALHPNIAPVHSMAPAQHVVPHPGATRSPHFVTHRSAFGARQQQLSARSPVPAATAAAASAATTNAYDGAQHMAKLVAAVTQLPTAQPALVLEGAPPFRLRFANDAWIASYRFRVSDIQGKPLAHLPNFSKGAKATLAASCLSIGCMAYTAPLYALECKVSVLLFTVTFYANHAHNLTRSPSHL